MAKLHYIYGTVGSGKTLHLLSVLHNYSKKGQTALVAKPAVDTRFGEKAVTSRSGLTVQANLLLEKEQTSVEAKQLEGHAAILLDECQFVRPELIDFLRLVSITKNLPVLCYGLKTDFRGELFPSTQRLIEISDTLEEVKNLCLYCDHKATMNLRMQKGEASTQGPRVLLGADDLYQAVCFLHYHELTERKE